MKSPVFLDTGYVLAVLNTRDKYYESASTAASKTSPPFITTEAVLIEIGKAFAQKDSPPCGGRRAGDAISGGVMFIIPYFVAQSTIFKKRQLGNKSKNNQSHPSFSAPAGAARATPKR